MATGQTSAMMAMRDPDIRLMLNIRAGDTSAFTQLVERYQHRLVAVLSHLLGNTEEAEDLAQEVFLRVYRNRDKYTPKAKFSTWLFTIANNLALNQIRNRKRRATVPLEFHDSVAHSAVSADSRQDGKHPAPSEGLKRKELASIIQHALTQLNERQRTAIILNKFEDMNYADIAEVLGMSLKAVKSLLSRARVHLRDALQPYIFMDAVPPVEETHDDVEL